MVVHPAIVVADGHGGGHGDLLGGGHLHEGLGHRPLDRGVGQGVDAGIDRLARPALVGDVHRRAHAVVVIELDDVLQQVLGQDRDQRPRTPALVVIGDLLHVGVLAVVLRLELGPGLGPAGDVDGDVRAVAARIGHQVAGGEDVRGQDLAGPLVGAQRQDVLGDVAHVQHRGHPGVEEAGQGLFANLAVHRPVAARRRPVGRGPGLARARKALEVDVDVHQSGDQVLAPAVDHPAHGWAGLGCGRDLDEAAVLHHHAHVGPGRMAAAVDQGDVLKGIGLGPRRPACPQQRRRRAQPSPELHAAFPTRPRRRNDRHQMVED